MGAYDIHLVSDDSKFALRLAPGGAAFNLSRVAHKCLVQGDHHENFCACSCRYVGKSLLAPAGQAAVESSSGPRRVRRRFGVGNRLLIYSNGRFTPYMLLGFRELNFEARCCGDQVYFSIARVHAYRGS